MPTLPAIGSLVADKYRIEALLGAGGMGAVFRARHELIGRPVALKWLHPSQADDPLARDRFIREARAAARIRHPNVVEVYDVGVHEHALFMVMELLEGETFEQILERGEMPIPRALRLLVGAMRGVSAAHKRDIVHRDIKPENIFVVYDDQHPDGLAKVLDFGISKLTDEAQNAKRITHTGTAMGTPLYMSFEQMSGAADVDVRTDIYSFGVLLYRALTGQQPFDGETLPALVMAIATRTPPSPKQLRPELPAALDRVVTKAIARERADRFGTMAELIDALTLLASTEGFLGQMTSPSASPPLLTPKTPSVVVLDAGRGPVPASAREVSVTGTHELNARWRKRRRTRRLVAYSTGCVVLASLAAWFMYVQRAANEPAPSGVRAGAARPVLHRPAQAPTAAAIELSPVGEAAPAAAVVQRAQPATVGTGAELVQPAELANETRGLEPKQPAAGIAPKPSGATQRSLPAARVSERTRSSALQPSAAAGNAEPAAHAPAPPAAPSPRAQGNADAAHTRPAQPSSPVRAVTGHRSGTLRRDQL